MKFLIALVALCCFSISTFCQSFAVNFSEYRFINSKQKIGVNTNLIKRVLNQQFTNLVTGQTKNSVGNFASLDPTDASISFAGNIISDSGSVLTVKAKGGVTDGFLPIFKNSKLNTNISLDVQYNMLALGKKQLGTNVDSTDQYERSVDKIEYEYNVKRLGIITLRDSNQLADKKDKAGKELDSLNKLWQIRLAELQKETDLDKIQVLTRKLSILTFDTSKAKLLVDSINQALIRYDTLEELQLLHNRTIMQLDKLSLQSSVEGFSFGWVSVGYKVTNNSFRLFSPAALFPNQLTDTSFVTHEARVQYSYYSWLPQKFKTFFFDIGAAFTYSDNFNSLKKTELSETTEYGLTPGLRTQIKKYNAYQGKYTRDLPGLNLYADYFQFLFPNNIAALHVNPELVTQKSEKPVSNFYVGFLLAFKNTKADAPVVNAELYYKFLDIFKTTESEYRLFERNNIGIRFTFPIQFKYK